MSDRKFYALGTASQVPTRHRNHNGYFLKWDKEGLLFDPGEGTQRQMIFSGVAASEITKIFITHFHGDHCLGLAGILQRLSLDRIQHEVEVYFPVSGLRYFENLKNASIYYNTAAIKPCPVEDDGIIFESPALTVTTLSLDHTVDCRGYRISEPDGVTLLPDKLSLFGIEGAAIGEFKKQGSLNVNGQVVTVADVSTLKKGQSLTFLMDTRYCPNAVRLAQDVDVLVSESTFLSEHHQEAESHGHLTAAQAARIAKEANAGQLVLTHFSQRYGEDGDFIGEASPIFPNVVAVSDGDCLNLRTGELYQ